MMTALKPLFQVKEKEAAHREYGAAVSQGHGAYLMDQDAPVGLDRRPLGLHPL